MSTRPKPNLRQAQKEMTRSMLVQRAGELFTERGYAPVTIDEITNAVGCSRATFYLHFSSKIDVLREVSRTILTERPVEVYAELDDILAAGDRSDFARWMRRALDWFLANRDFLPVWDEAASLEPEFRKVSRVSSEELADAMPKFLATWPAERQAEARLRVILLVSQLERFFTRWIVQGAIDTTPEEAARVLTDIWYPALSEMQPRK
ncbi:TetR/AcrR family transcriptional regulator [Enemella sp. A6]|uniref:TetR/AcrR family transcriptional regulator n=1 Tax=Enemella sp. A6 TaxID=3440152 RepID=UPI003EBC44F6